MKQFSEESLCENLLFNPVLSQYCCLYSSSSLSGGLLFTTTFFLQNLISKVEHVSGDVPQTSICTKILANIFLPGSLRVHGPPYKSSVQTEDGSVGTELREKLKRIGENKFFLNKKEEWG